MMLGKLCPCIGQFNSLLYKINSEWIKGLSVTFKLLDKLISFLKKYGQTFQDVSIGRDSGKDSVRKEKNHKSWQMGLREMQKLLNCRENNWQKKETA